MILQERDYLIFKELHRWRFLFGRHVKILCDFPSVRSCDRRLKILTDCLYLAKKKVIYGLPYFYTLTYKSKILIGAGKRAEKLKIDRIYHDACVVDCAMFFMEKFDLNLNDITTEKEMHIQDGFGTRSHKPDFVFIKDNVSYAVEVELSLKARERLEKNIRDNYLNYAYQYWIISSYKSKLFALLEGFKTTYGNIKINVLEEMKK